MKTCTVKAWDSIKSAIDKQYVMSKAHEIRNGSGERVPKDAIRLIMFVPMVLMFVSILI